MCSLVECQCIRALVRRYREGSTLRPDVLFTKFLPEGYRQTSLSSVDQDLRQLVVLAKVHLGMIITLYDDLADHPRYRNPSLLRELYQLNLGLDRRASALLTKSERQIFELARFLFHDLAKVLADFPHARLLARVLQFDVEQFYIANRYSELITENPHARNLRELHALGPYNMGIVAAGTLDLMASPNFSPSTLGQAREVFLLGQRLGRISNLIFTFSRELDEGDCTNEIAIASGDSQSYCAQLMAEFQERAARICAFKMATFDVNAYANGFRRLYDLHSSLAGQI